MAGTLVGVFDDYADAERARDRLASAGLNREAIQITPERSSWGSGDATWGGRAERPGGLDVERIGEQARSQGARRYSGVERRRSNGQYNGADRRAAATR